MIPGEQQEKHVYFSFSEDKEYGRSEVAVPREVTGALHMSKEIVAPSDNSLYVSQVLVCSRPFTFIDPM